MSESIKKVAVRARGLERLYAYASRLADRYYIHRWGIGPALAQAAPWVGEEELGFVGRPLGMHIPTGAGQFAAIRAAMKRFVKPQASDVFLDYGSGLGSVLLMAATFPFARVLGVEISADMAQRSRQIIDPIRQQLRCRDIQVINSNALAFDVPDDVSVIYFFNPFWGEVMEEVLDRIHRSLLNCPRPLRFISFWPENFEKAASSRRWISRIGELKYPDSFYRPLSAPMRVYTVNTDQLR